ncbi:MAG: PKD domain-containing protein, partial [Tepidisphaeraceae bacterium]
GPDNTGEVGAPVPVITAISRTVQAGHSIHVNALASNFKSGDALSAKYEWNFGDANGRWNTLSGWNAAHVYDKPGTYTIALRVTNSAGKVATTTTQVTIAASTRRVIYVSNDGSDANSGTSPDNAVKSFARAMSFATSDTEILFQRGDSWTLDAGGRVSGRNVVIGAYGSGSRPVLKYTGPAGYASIIAVSSTSQDVTVRGLAFDMHFSDLENKSRPNAVSAAGVNVTVRDNEFVNIGYAVNANADPRGMLVVDNVAPRAEAIRSYFVWAEGSDISIVGNTVANSTREHNIRVVRADRILIAHNDLTNTTGQVSGDRIPKGSLTIQRGSYIYISRNQLNDAPVTIGPLAGGDGLKSIGDRWNWAVVEENELNTRLNIDHGAAHVMVRNNVFCDTDKSPVEVEGWDDTFNRGVSDVRIVDNVALSSGREFVRCTGGEVVGLKQTGNDFVSSVSRLTLWGEDGISSPTQWQQAA